MENQGMFSSAPPNKKGYSGIVNVKGDKVLVDNGKASYEGNTFRVFGNGEMVADSRNQIIGYIENQIFKPLTEEHLSKLKKMGMAE